MQTRHEGWWRSAVIYEIALISFQDFDGDGKGDLAGLIGRIDYLQWLGVDAVWLTPIQKSPMRDFGYDIADYCAVDPAVGTIEDFDRLLAALHRARIRLILDLVPNHTSNEHPWFKESSSSSSNAKRLIRLRRDERTLVEGDYQPLRARNDVLCYARRLGERRLLVGLNISDEPRRWTFGAEGRQLLSTCLDDTRDEVAQSFILRGNEGAVLAIES